MGFMDDLKKLAKPYSEDADDDFDEFDDLDDLDVCEDDILCSFEDENAEKAEENTENA